jgi:hypothetical protein
MNLIASFPRISMTTALFVLLALAACEQTGKPGNILPQEEMVPVIKDLEIAYAGVDQTVKDPKQRQEKYEEMNSLVLRKYKLEKDQFFTSYQWYESQPVLLDSIFKQVIKELNVDLIPLQNNGNVRPRAEGSPQE